jgi:acetate kinase
MQGLTGDTDMRDVEDRYLKGDKVAVLAYEMYAYRIKHFIGSYVASMNGIDAIVFTAGIGENDPVARRLVCENMDYFGIKLDEEKNKLRSKEIREINTADSATKVLVIPTNEELEIAKQSLALVK